MTSTGPPHAQDPDELARYVFDALPACLAVVDGTGVIVRINLAWGLEPITLPGVGCHYDAVSTALSASAVAARRLNVGLGRVLEADARAFTQECRNERMNRWFEVKVLALRSDARGGLLIAIEEITARKEAEEAQRRERQLFHSVVENIPTSVQVKAVADELRIVLWNRAAESIYGFPRTHAIGSNAHDLWPAEIANDMHASDNALIEAGGQQEFPDRLSHTWSGNEIRMHMRKVPLYDEAGTPTHLLIIADDVTEQRKKERQIQDLNLRLEERVSQRTRQLESANAELQAFAHSVAHDLRGPLTTINGFAHRIEHHNGDEPGAQEGRAASLARIKAAVTHMDELTTALLGLAQLARTALRWETTDLGALALAVVARLRETHPAHVVDVTVEAGLTASCDRVLLTQVMENLIGNAWKFSSKVAQPQIVVGRERMPDGTSHFYVSDNGVGFDEMHAARLFGAFQRLHRESDFPGTGIGLATVHRIVTRHGGRIWASSTPGHGARFMFTLGARPLDE